MNEQQEQVGNVSGGDGPAATPTSAETKVEVDPAPQGGEDSRQAGGNEGPASPTKIKFTGKVRRGLALFRMVQMASQSDDCPSIPTFISRWTKAQQSDYNAALAWCEQEEDWESVEDAWERGKRGGK